MKTVQVRRAVSTFVAAAALAFAAAVPMRAGGPAEASGLLILDAFTGVRPELAEPMLDQMRRLVHEPLADGVRSLARAAAAPATEMDRSRVEAARALLAAAAEPGQLSRLRNVLPSPWSPASSGRRLDAAGQDESSILSRHAETLRDFVMVVDSIHSDPAVAAELRKAGELASGSPKDPRELAERLDELFLGQGRAVIASAEDSGPGLGDRPREAASHAQSRQTMREAGMAERP